ncbi:VOC family protein [Agrococcus jenensis]|uniref:Catechol 2,3-dioxygenase n=1 Tax=Agrococcus jenensis TaxID=46353 RepID=A0A3N2AUQ0_9MICO|nr:VOC family protein [Agrococcus jenensis]ROR66769.1 catechol 2,3-dioxygenase [Agrococcus jenensis]
MTTIDLLPDATAMGPVMLKTAKLARLVHWYTTGAGLQHVAERPGAVELGVDGRTILVLEEAPDLRGPSPSDAGLFHTAILFPTQAALAAAVVRMSQIPGIQFAGTGDHHVSEAFYFADPDGNGVELYADRPRDRWEWANGHVHMTTEFIDPNGFVDEHLDRGAFGTSQVAPADARVGHVHLQVGDVPTARAFYVDALGFAETASLGGTALFVSAGGYHHHMAMNVWNSRGAGRRADTLGLGRVEITVPDADALGAARQRLAARGVAVADDGRSIRFDDPWANAITLTPFSLVE